MRIDSFGKAGNPVVLLLPAQGMEPDILRLPLADLEKSYRLLTVSYEVGDTVGGCARSLSEYLLQNCVGRIWGAYGLRFGGDVLLELLPRRGLFVRTVVVDSASVLPAVFPGEFGGALWYWTRHRNKSCKTVMEALRKAFPELRTLTLKKLKTGQEYWLVRPDRMANRLKKTFGSARIVSVSTVMEESTEKVWNKLLLRPNGKASRRLKDRRPLFRLNDEHVQILEGSAAGVSHWSHLTRLKALDDHRTEYTDQVEYAAGLLNAPVGIWTRLYLKKCQRNRKKQK